MIKSFLDLDSFILKPILVLMLSMLNLTHTWLILLIQICMVDKSAIGVKFLGKAKWLANLLKAQNITYISTLFKEGVWYYVIDTDTLIMVQAWTLETIDQNAHSAVGLIKLPACYTQYLTPC